jgi:hypothetical protein
MLLFAAGLAASVPHTALAQTQDGRALERNLKVGGRNEKFSQRANFRDEVQLRNALITGNVGGGKAFRGNVGYTAPGEFRGTTAGDSTFAFRRDSASSASLRGGDALRYQFTGTTGRGSAGGGLETYSRFGATGRAAVSAGAGNTSSTFGTSGTGAFRARPGTLRSTSAFAATQGLGASIVGYEATDTGYAPITASPLLGVRRPSDQRAPLGGVGGGVGELDTRPNSALTSAQREARAQRERGSLAPSLSQPLDTSVSGAEEIELGVGGGAGGERRAGRSRTVADDLNDRLRQRPPKVILEPGKAPVAPDAPAAPDAPQAPGTREPTGEPTRQPAVKENPSGASADINAAHDEVQARLNILREKLIPKGNRLGEKPEAEPAATEDRDGDGKPDALPRSGIDEETIRLIREAGGRTRQFIDPATGKPDKFTEHMTIGQELLGSQKYFDAEERFARALEERQGDPTAMAARMHAQLGAGLYLSAALNLRTLMAEHPELAGLRYTGSTIPSAERLASIASDLRANVLRAKDAGITPGSADGLLVAYIGWQLGDRAMTAEGLGVARAGLKLIPGGAPEPEKASLLELLEGVWVGGGPEGTK